MFTFGMDDERRRLVSVVRGMEPEADDDETLRAHEISHSDIFMFGRKRWDRLPAVSSWKSRPRKMTAV